jgi:hypothetical protein
VDSHPADFARSFGDALQRFLEQKHIRPIEASKRMSVESATLNTYLHDNRKGKRAKANAEVLAEACIQLGFVFEYRGHKISASPIENGNPSPNSPSEQLSFNYENQFNLSDELGNLSVRIQRRPSGRVELDLHLKAVS